MIAIDGERLRQELERAVQDRIVEDHGVDIRAARGNGRYESAFQRIARGRDAGDRARLLRQRLRRRCIQAERLRELRQEFALAQWTPRRRR
jgi:hypothetical protein